MEIGRDVVDAEGRYRPIRWYDFIVNIFMFLCVFLVGFTGLSFWADFGGAPGVKFAAKHIDAWMAWSPLLVMGGYWLGAALFANFLVCHKNEYFHDGPGATWFEAIFASLFGPVFLIVGVFAVWFCWPAMAVLVLSVTMLSWRIEHYDAWWHPSYREAEYNPSRFRKLHNALDRQAFSCKRKVKDEESH